MGQIGPLSTKVTHLFSNCSHLPQLDNPWGTSKDNWLPGGLVAKTRPDQSSWLGDQLASQNPNPTWPARLGKITHPNSCSTWHQWGMYPVLTPHHAKWPIKHGPDWATLNKSHTPIFQTAHICHNLITHGVHQVTTACLVDWWQRQGLISQVD